jgi:hypothetical protein
MACNKKIGKKPGKWIDKWLGRKPNRTYKDSLFRAIFKNADEFRKLYSTVKGRTYGENTVMKETTLTDAIYLNVKNDVSFEIDGKIVVFMEHQSTINPNIAMRMLIYAAETYRPMADPNMIYGPKKMVFPRPEFYVFYNGERKMPERQTIRLSELFEPCDDKNPPSLDLVVDMYNINMGNNPGLLRDCETLSHYEIFVELVREYEKAHNQGAAVEFAVIECMKRGVLTEYLKKYGTKEVVSMLCVELDEAVQRKLWTDFGREEGRAEGMEEVLALVEKGVSADEIRRAMVGKRVRGV